MKFKLLTINTAVILTLILSGSSTIALSATTKEAGSTAKTAATPIAKPVEKKLISLDLRNVDINTVLQVFAKETGMSIVAGKNVYGTVTISLNKVDPTLALGAILKANGYTYKKEGNVITVFASEEPVRIQKMPDGTYISTFIINYVTPTQLRATLVKILPSRVKLHVTEGNKTLVAQGYLNDIKRTETLIRDIDIPPKQVMVESKIIEVSLNESTNLGVNFKEINPKNPNEYIQTSGLAAEGAKGVFYSITSSNQESVVAALATRTGFNILSSPKVIALNDETAEIITGGRLGYRVKTYTETGMIESVEFLDVGTKLVITPSIKSDGNIVMEIHPEISEGKIEDQLPQKNSTETTTKVVVKDGQTIVIGGLVRNSQKKEVNGVPILMDIPVLGAIFKGTEIISEKKEIIVLITPHIINSEIIDAMEDQINEINAKREYLTPHTPGDLLK
ncbi:secretin and TonB N-terminal domain-containing protein [Candidatus Margulisiibacteriota bacterium]